MFSIYTHSGASSFTFPCLSFIFVIQSFEIEERQIWQDKGPMQINRTGFYEYCGPFQEKLLNLFDFSKRY